MKMPPRILMVAPFCYPPSGSEAIATAKLILAMRSAGWKIDVISQSDFGHFYPASENGLWNPVREVVLPLQAMEAKPAFWKWAIPPGRIQSIFWSAKAFRAGSRLLAAKPYDFIFSRSTPLYGHLPALLLAWRTGAPWVASWSDPLPPEKAPAPYGNGPAGSAPFFQERFCEVVGEKASWHIFPCERLRRNFASYLPGIASKSSVIPHIALAPVPAPEQRSSSAFTLCHVGSLAHRNPRTFLEGLTRFLGDSRVKSAVKVRFTGTNGETLGPTVRALGLNALIEVEGPRPYEETLAVMGRSTVLVVIEAPCAEGVFFPSKFVDYVQTGRPILAVSPRDGTLSDILSQRGGGIAADCTSPGSIADALKTLYHAWKKGCLDARFGSSHLMEVFGTKETLDRYKKLALQLQRASYGNLN